eukprot:TRINITY_DN9177_c0_g1_i1.p1 TRINITY_DN9177_c0_g1~~TRINITY_DN9177_c0_g1_i1.p1  ORF type:complete len:535 (+),score=39.55 TRINITY_DN9177_c0_g1_i1:23-1627(+)
MAAALQGYHHPTQRASVLKIGPCHVEEVSTAFAPAAHVFLGDDDDIPVAEVVGLFHPFRSDSDVGSYSSRNLLATSKTTNFCNQAGIKDSDGFSRGLSQRSSSINEGTSHQHQRQFIDPAHPESKLSPKQKFPSSKSESSGRKEAKAALKMELSKGLQISRRSLSKHEMLDTSASSGSGSSTKGTSPCARISPRTAVAGSPGVKGVVPPSRSPKAQGPHGCGPHGLLSPNKTVLPSPTRPLGPPQHVNGKTPSMAGNSSSLLSVEDESFAGDGSRYQIPNCSSPSFLASSPGAELGHRDVEQLASQAEHLQLQLDVLQRQRRQQHQVTLQPSQQQQQHYRSLSVPALSSRSQSVSVSDQGAGFQPVGKGTHDTFPRPSNLEVETSPRAMRSQSIPSELLSPQSPCFSMSSKKAQQYINSPSGRSKGQPRGPGSIMAYQSDDSSTNDEGPYAFVRASSWSTSLQKSDSLVSPSSAGSHSRNSQSADKRQPLPRSISENHGEEVHTGSNNNLEKLRQVHRVPVPAPKSNSFKKRLK